MQVNLCHIFTALSLIQDSALYHGCKSLLSSDLGHFSSLKRMPIPLSGCISALPLS